VGNIAGASTPREQLIEGIEEIAGLAAAKFAKRKIGP
jgi:hypothetical protein